MMTEVPVDPDILELVPFFMSSRAQDYKTILKSLESKDFDSIAKTAHTIKGIARPYGYPTLELLAKELEKSAKASNEHMVRDCLGRLNAFLQSYSH